MQLAELEKILDTDGIVFLNYGGFLTHSLIVGMTEALEKESEANDISMKIAGNILTIFIELSQNMMNYSKKLNQEGNELDPKGLILVGYKEDLKQYYIFSRNILNQVDKDRIEPKLEEVMPLDKNELKKLYRERRKSGKNTHEKGAGIGFIEIARRCDKMEYSFSPIDDLNHQYYFLFKAMIVNQN